MQLIDLGQEVEYIDIDVSKVPYTFSVKLSDKTYSFTIRYNDTGGFFTLDLSVTATGEVLAYGDPIRYGRPLFGPIEDALSFAGHHSLVPHGGRCGRRDVGEPGGRGQALSLRQGGNGMSFWMREASLQIGSKKYSMDNLYFEFEVPFEDSDTIQTAKFKAYNLSESTRKGIKRGDVIILNAGYEGDVGAIFVGQVSACSHKHQNTEWITEISATAAMDQWLNSKVSKTYAKGSTAKEIVSDLLNIFGVEIGDFSLATNKVYDRGLVCNGKVKDELKRIVVNDCKSRFLIRNGSVFINDPTKGIANGLVLTPQSGLLLSGNEVEETVIAVGSDSQKSSATKSGEGNYVTRECLLNYHIGPAEQVVIQSHSLNGRFIVAKGKHTGTPKGNWKTTIEMKPA